MAKQEVNIDQLRKSMPWQEVVHPNGQVQMVDKTGKEVPLFTLTALLVVITRKMAIKETT